MNAACSSNEPVGFRVSLDSIDGDGPSIVVKVAKSVLRIVLGVVIGATLTLVLFERHLIYYPSRTVAATPKELGLAFEDVFLDVEPNARIHGWFIPARQIPSTATVLFSHGNAGNIADRLDRVQSLRDLNLDMFLYDYRGFGRSTGVPDEEGTYKDGRAAYEYLVRTRGVDPKRLILMGESLGCAITMELVMERPAAAVVLEAPFASIAHMAAAVYPFLPLRPFVRTRYDNLAKASRLKTPLFVVHGARDEIIPTKQGRMVFDAAPEPKTYLEIPGAHHNDVYVVGGSSYRAALLEFVRKATAGPASPLIEEKKP